MTKPESQNGSATLRYISRVHLAYDYFSALGSSRNTSEDDTSMQFFMYAGQVLSFQKTAGHNLYMLFHPRWRSKNKMAAEKQWTLISLCVEPIDTSFFIYFICFQGQGIHFCKYNIRKITRWRPKNKMAAEKQWTLISLYVEPVETSFFSKFYMFSGSRNSFLWI